MGIPLVQLINGSRAASLDQWPPLWRCHQLRIPLNKEGLPFCPGAAVKLCYFHWPITSARKSMESHGTTKSGSICGTWSSWPVLVSGVHRGALNFIHRGALSNGHWIWPMSRSLESPALYHTQPGAPGLSSYKPRPTRPTAFPLPIGTFQFYHTKN